MTEQQIQDAVIEADETGLLITVRDVSGVEVPNYGRDQLITILRRRLSAPASELPSEREELERLRIESAWIRKKLDLPTDTPFVSGGDGKTLAGAMHVVCDHAHGYMTYIVSHRCNDKQGEIARLTVENADLRNRLLSAAGDDLCRLTQEEIKAYSAGAVKIPPKEEFLASCERFHAQVAKESGVLEGCLTLAQLIAENAALTAELSQARAEAADRDEWAAKYSATFGQLTAALERAEAAEAELAKVYDQRDAAYKRIQAIIEVAGHLQPTDIRNAACWIIAPPHVGIPRLEEWIIDAQISQRWNEIDRVEKVINLCLEKHFSELRQRAEGAEAELSEAKRELQEVYWIYQISMEAHEAAEAERERLREALANVRKTPIGTIAERIIDEALAAPQGGDGSGAREKQ